MGNDKKTGEDKNRENQSQNESQKDLSSPEAKPSQAQSEGSSPNMLKNSSSSYESDSVFSPQSNDSSDRPRAARKRRLTVKEKMARAGAASISTIVLTGQGH
ncbi:hypothetical protein GW915_00845 [bacterium]|nr:hypothetical protein [bacterium]